MTEAAALLKRGIAAVQAGDLEEGKCLLERVLKDDPYNEEAWYWLSAAVDDVEERKACLRRVLGLDYYNEEAWRKLYALVLSPPARSRPGEPLAQAEGSEFPCPGCESDLRYSPRRGTLACEHCGTVVGIPHDPGPPRSYPLAGMPATREAKEEWIGQQIYRCPGCGARTTCSTRLGSLQCPFCGSSSLLKQPPDVPLIRPQAVLPFKLDHADAEQVLRHWLGSRRLRPGDLPRRAAIERLHGAYVPFWLFSSIVLIQWRDENGILGSTTRIYGNIPICASLSLTTEVVREIEPFDFEALVSFRPEYVAGWPVELYQIALIDAANEARRHVRQDAERIYPRLELVHSEDIRWRLALLPVFVGAYRYRGRTYLFTINGQTGKVSGDAPHDNLLQTLKALWQS